MPLNAFLGLAHRVPTTVVTNDDLAEMFDTSNEWIQLRTGIRVRPGRECNVLELVPLINRHGWQ